MQICCDVIPHGGKHKVRCCIQHIVVPLSSRMVTDSTKAKSYKTFFDDAPPLVGFYYPSPQKCLRKGQKKIDIRAERQGSNVLPDDSEGFTIAGRDSAISFTFNESWSSTEHGDESGEPSNREEHADHKFADREFWPDKVENSKSLHHQDDHATNSGSEDQYSSWDSTILGGNQKPASQGSLYREVLEVQKKANKLLKSAKPLFSSATKGDNSLINEGFAEETHGLKQNSTLNNDVSDERKGHWLNEKKPSTHSVGIQEGQVERNADDISVDSSDFLVSTEGLGGSSGTIASSDEVLFRPSFVNIQDTNENKCLDHYTSDLPFCQYWKSNLNEDILYQWRIKRRIQLAREQAKSEKQRSVPSRIFTQSQVNAEIQTSPLKHYPTSDSHSSPLVESYFDQSVSHNSQVSACSHMNCDIQPSKHLSHNVENPDIPLVTTSESDQLPSGKTTEYHKYLVAEKPHCSNFDSNIPSSLQNKNKNSKTQTRNVSKPDKFHGQKLGVNRRMENKSLQTDPKDLNDDSCKLQTVLTYSKHTDKTDSRPHQNYHQVSIPGESTESSNEFTDDLLQFNDDHSSSDEEFSSDLMLQHLRKKRSTFKEQLRFIDEELKVLLNSTPD